MPICIAGMHRSGTSMVTRLLNLCGVCLGADEEFIAPAEDNPEGYWENLHFYNINNELLNLFQGGWDLPPRLPAGWEGMPELDSLRAQGAELVERFNRRYPVWGWKDPRNSLTLPFWQSLIPGLQVVIPLRNPLEVAQSLTKRGRSSTVFGLDLWRTYNRAVLAAVRPVDRVITEYETYFQDAPREVRRVLAALGLAATEETIAHACASVSAELHRQRSSLADMAEAGVPRDVIELYVALKREAGSGGAPDTENISATAASPVTPAAREPTGPELRGLLLGAREQVRQRDAAIVNLQAQAMHLDGRLAEETRKTEWLQAQIQAMEATRFWQLGRLYWRAHDRVTAWFKPRVKEKEKAEAVQPERRPIFSLDAQAATAVPAVFERMVEQFRLRLGRAPEILDWHTGANLATASPGLVVFSPPTADSTLPYLDETIDLVVIPSSQPERRTEATRVARTGVLTLGANGDKPQVDIVWKKPERAPGPIVSIIIPCYNRAAVTARCLDALHRTLPPDLDCAIIVVDDASTDDTAQLLKDRQAREPRLAVLRNATNSGFVASCNRGAMAATGEFLLFLNNDTIPLAGWLTALMETFHTYPDAGAVGAKLVLPDGHLQEAGDLVFGDGSAANFGRGAEDLDAPLYNYVRQVDYCSGACLATPLALFKQLNGFDARYAPAYYEDVDYCFQVRAAGRAVYYQPACVVIHAEGSTAGTDTATGVKQYQVVNQAKFQEKWQNVLAQQPARPAELGTRELYALADRRGSAVVK